MNGDHELSRLQAQVSNLSSELARLQALVAQGVRSTDADDDVRGKVVTDAPWKCRKCRSLLGFYDAVSDVMRIRYKDHISYFRLGPGGFVQVICRGCGEINTESYATNEEIEASRAKG